ncbi:hypothetical protein PMZ80_007097 [Knufia obscura]|uniref:F-box domain-containing protein n=1 Tax=Knufia obscura TaxID=1635080 RepID=A0ABR0RJB9_9EURO|nr:hypothetical protein PMZ80_007097 [Knufia obscura]
MATWHNLPAELHLLIFRHLFSGRTVSFRLGATPPGPDDHLLAILTVSKSFCKRNTAVGTMLQHAEVKIGIEDLARLSNHLSRYDLSMLRHFKAPDCVIAISDGILHVEDIRIVFLNLRTINLGHCNCYSKEYGLQVSPRSGLHAIAQSSQEKKTAESRFMFHGVFSASSYSESAAKPTFDLAQQYKNGDINEEEASTLVARNCAALIRNGIEQFSVALTEAETLGVEIKLSTSICILQQGNGVRSRGWTYKVSPQNVRPLQAFEAQD